MTINVSPDPRLQFFGNDGKPLVGGKLYTYAAGTTTLLATYTDWYGTTPNTNPIILDSRGEASVWLGTARYKFVLKDANDVEVYTQDNLIMSPGADGAGSYGTWPIDITGAAGTVTGGVVNSIIAGSGIAVDHATGNVTVSLAGSGTAVTSITSAVPGFSFTGTNAVTMNGPAPGANGNIMTSNGSAWVSSVVSTPQGAKAWVNFNGTLSGTITPRASYNVSSVTKNATGDYKITFSTALADANYVVAGSANQASNGNPQAFSITPTTAMLAGSVSIGLGNPNNGAYLDCSIVTVVFFGN